MPVGSSLQRPVSQKKEENIPRDVSKALLKATKRSTHRRHQTGCVIVSKKGEILSTGCSHTSSLRMNELHSIHAEIHALGRGRYENLLNATAYICTMARKSENFVFSKPCLTCAIALRAAGIKEVIFHNGDNHPMKHQWNTLMLEGELQNHKVYPRRKK